MEAFLQVSISKYCLPYRHSSMKKPLYGRQYRAEISIINVPMWHKQDITNLYHIWCHFLFQLKTVTSSINHKPATQAWLGLNRQVMFDQPPTNPVRSPSAKRVVEVSISTGYTRATLKSFFYNFLLFFDAKHLYKSPCQSFSCVSYRL